MTTSHLRTVSEIRSLGRPGKRHRQLAATALNGPRGRFRQWPSKAKDVVAYKNEIRSWAKRNQRGLCAYCDLPLGRGPRRTDELDHFIPKGKYQEDHPSISFDPFNLVLACGYCNTRQKKSFDPTVGGLKSARIRSNQFTILNPYFDRVFDHIEGGRFTRGAPKPVKAKSRIGKETIDKFELDSPEILKEWLMEELYIRNKQGGNGAKNDPTVNRILDELRNV